jgi:hypothetical protein
VLSWNAKAADIIEKLKCALAAFIIGILRDALHSAPIRSL